LFKTEYFGDMRRRVRKIPQESHEEPCYILLEHDARDMLSWKLENYEAGKYNLLSIYFLYVFCDSGINR
jgi:hypothetical protein